jgi:hypothetical protein
LDTGCPWERHMTLTKAAISNSGKLLKKADSWRLSLGYIPSSWGNESFGSEKRSGWHSTVCTIPGMKSKASSQVHVRSGWGINAWKTMKNNAWKEREAGEEVAALTNSLKEF